MADLTCGNPRCIPCQCEAAAPGSGTYVVCPQTEQRILNGPQPATPALDRFQAWVKNGGHIRVQQAIGDEQVRRDFGRFIHELLGANEAEAA